MISEDELFNVLESGFTKEALEEQLQKLPIQKNEQGILYREFKDTNQFLKRVFYLKQGETLNINAANENIWIKVLSGNGDVNKGEYEEIRPRALRACTGCRICECLAGCDDCKQRLYDGGLFRPRKLGGELSAERHESGSRSFQDDR
jgi:hypothetical protein